MLRVIAAAGGGVVVVVSLVGIARVMVIVAVALNVMC